jgi:hypothetical protein
MIFFTVKRGVDAVGARHSYAQRNHDCEHRHRGSLWDSDYTAC